MVELWSKTRCQGQCCLDFNIANRSRESIVNEAIALSDQDTTYAREVAFIADMIRPISGPSPVYADKWVTDDVHHFECRHFDKEKKICTVYDQRPSMCRRYPNGHQCEFTGCTWDPEEAQLISHVIHNGYRQIASKCDDLIQIGRRRSQFVKSVRVP